MTTLSGVLGFVAVNYKPVSNYLDIWFWSITSAAILSLVISGYFLVNSYRVPHLNDIAKPSEWVSYWDEIMKKYKEGDGDFASAQDELTDHLIHLYSEIADENIDVNDRKGTRLVYSNYSLLAAFVLLVLTSLTYYFNNHLIQGGSTNKGEAIMLSNKNAFICIQSSFADLFESNGKLPGKRPVPDPSEPPMPPPG